jgi:hypothetical protein
VRECCGGGVEIRVAVKAGTIIEQSPHPSGETTPPRVHMLRPALLLILFCIVWKRNTHGFLRKRGRVDSRGPRLRLVENNADYVFKLIELVIPAFSSLVVPAALVTGIINSEKEARSEQSARVEQLITIEKESRKEQSERAEQLIATEKESRKEQSDRVEQLITTEKESRKVQSDYFLSLLDSEKESRRDILKAFEDRLTLAITRLEATSSKLKGGSE